MIFQCLMVNRYAHRCSDFIMTAIVFTDVPRIFQFNTANTQRAPIVFNVFSNADQFRNIARQWYNRGLDRCKPWFQFQNRTCFPSPRSSSVYASSIRAIIARFTPIAVSITYGIKLSPVCGSEYANFIVLSVFSITCAAILNSFCDFVCDPKSKS